MPPYEIYELADFQLQRGTTLAKAVLAYQAYGELRPDRSNAILYTTSYGAQHTDLEWLIAPGKILDPREYFIVLVNQFGNGAAEVSEHEARRIRKSIYLPIPSIWGHRAGNPVKNPEDEQFIARAVKERLAS
jgi:homoserine acetyltransferase